MVTLEKEEPRYLSDNAFHFIDVVRSDSAAKLVEHPIGALGAAEDILLTTRHLPFNAGLHLVFDLIHHAGQFLRLRLPMAREYARSDSASPVGFMHGKTISATCAFNSWEDNDSVLSKDSSKARMASMFSATHVQGSPRCSTACSRPEVWLSGVDSEGVSVALPQPAKTRASTHTVLHQAFL